LTDNRAHSRKVVGVRIEGRSEFGIFTRTTQNLSQGGMFITTEAPYPEGTVLELTMSLDDRSILLEGEVVWRKLGGAPDESGMGVVIIEINPQDQAVLNKFLGE